MDACSQFAGGCRHARRHKTMPSQVNALTASYAKGRTDVPLIEQTIGDFLLQWRAPGLA
jgi:hypothetical protein